MEKAKAQQEVSDTPPMQGNRPPPAHDQRAQPSASRFVPFVAHTGGRPLSSFNFVFYRPTFSNSLAPFYSTYKPVCGYRFQQDARHGRSATDVENANLGKWRPIHGRRP